MSEDRGTVMCQGTRSLYYVRGQGVCIVSNDKGIVVCQGKGTYGVSGAYIMPGDRGM